MWVLVVTRYYTTAALSGPLKTLNSVIRRVALGSFRPDLPRSRYFAGDSEKVEGPAAKRFRAEVALASMQMDGSTRKALEVVEVDDSDDGFGEPVKLELPEPVSVANAQELLQDVEQVRPAHELDLPEAPIPAVTVAENEADRLRDFSIPSSDDDSDDSDSFDEDSLGAGALVSRAQASNGSDNMFVHRRTATIHKGNVKHRDKLACGRALLPVFKSTTDLEAGWIRCKVCFGTSV